MMDISDGLGSEILHLCRQSELGCVLYEEKIPIADDTRNAAYKFELDPTACALSGGRITSFFSPFPSRIMINCC